MIDSPLSSSYPSYPLMLGLFTEVFIFYQTTCGLRDHMILEKILAIPRVQKTAY